MPPNTHDTSSRWLKFASRVEVAEFIFSSILWFALPLGIVSVTAAVLLIWWSSHPRLALGLSAVWLVVLVPAEYLVLQFFNKRLERLPILAPASFAMEQPRYPLVLRPLIAVWWLVHFAITVLGTQLLMEYYQRNMESRYMSTAAGWLMVVGVTIASTAAAHFFLVLAVAALLRRHRLVELTWRARHFIEAAIVAAILAGWLSLDAA